MENTLEKLWEMYQTANPTKINRDSNTNAVLIAARRFRSTLTEEQEILLEEFEAELDHMNAITEKEAFIKGVRFATQYLTDALQIDKTT